MRSLWMFLITVILSLAIFGMLAFNIVDNVFDFQFKTPGISDAFAESNDGETDDSKNPVNTDKNPDKGNNGDDGPGQSTTPGGSDISQKKEKELTLLFIRTDCQPSLYNYEESGYNEDGVYVKRRDIAVDSLLLVKINTESQTFMFSSIPGNTVINKVNNKTVSDMYNQKGAEYVADCIYALTGIQAEYTSVIGIDDTLTLYEEIGNIMFDVPCDMVFYYPERDIEIELPAGLQVLTPDLIQQLLLFDDYSKDYIYTKESVHVKVALTVFEKLTTKTYRNKAVEAYNNLMKFYETNFTEDIFKDNIDLIYSFENYQPLVVTYPGQDNVVDNRTLFIPSISEALAAFEEFK